MLDDRQAMLQLQRFGEWRIARLVRPWQAAASSAVRVCVCFVFVFMDDRSFFSSGGCVFRLV